MATQETFYDAVANDPKMTRLRKIHWLRTAAKDYWERLEAVEPVLRELVEYLNPEGTPRDDSGLHDLHGRVVEALRVVEGGR